MFHKRFVLKTWESCMVPVAHLFSEVSILRHALQFEHLTLKCVSWWSAKTFGGPDEDGHLAQVQFRLGSEKKRVRRKLRRLGDEPKDATIDELWADYFGPEFALDLKAEKRARYLGELEQHLVDNLRDWARQYVPPMFSAEIRDRLLEYPVGKASA